MFQDISLSSSKSYLVIDSGALVIDMHSGIACSFAQCRSNVALCFHPNSPHRLDHYHRSMYSISPHIRTNFFENQAEVGFYFKGTTTNIRVKRFLFEG